MKPVISLSHVSFAYPGGPYVLENINLTVYRGEFLVILGPNGAAKTTLLKLMLGLLKPLKGSVEINTETKAVVNYIPQKSSALNPGFPATVEEVVKLQVAVKGKTASSLVHSVLEKVGLLEKRDTLVSSLSGGQFQRMLIARSLINHPQILFLDEPTTGLDAEAQEDFLSLLVKLNKEGLTIVMVTHDVSPVLDHASRFLYISKGKGKEVAKEDLKVV
ncbi:MAG: metal ABC transporter ATP-binding protein [Bacillota bacterium]|uniref:ATP-binding cassette domain-containing protein n=1 Tax=Thermanaerosceptrum fracticalcis TaxID=1712410 RepID=A0A7G6E2Z0_THEFR|nr:metal ABC transporter ATP-binding protein [Thermanaerosceptrum fracticalcis]QNB46444.1 ATP-binding cassette domain-containing protein [Thermanaerosceptrum fracticalcis]